MSVHAFSRDARGNIRWRAEPAKITVGAGIDEATARELVDVVNAVLVADADHETQLAIARAKEVTATAAAFTAELALAGVTAEQIARMSVGQWAAQLRRGRAADGTEQLELTNARGQLVCVLPAENPLRWLAQELRAGRNPINPTR